MRLIRQGLSMLFLGLAMLGLGCKEVAVAPTGLGYSANPAVYTVGTAIPTNSPTHSGGSIDAYTVSPALPAGLALDARSGVIAGTPTLVAATASYTVTGTNAAGSTTVSLSLTVNGPALTLTSQPANQAISVGQTATFTVVASGTGTLSYQWSKGGVALSGATLASYTTPIAVLADSGSTFSVQVSDAFGSSVSSASATLTVSATGPTITTQPANQSISEGQTATFSVLATGTGPLSYQWSKGGVALSGATLASYTTPIAVLADNGSTFSVLVSDGLGASVASASATLTVLAAGGPGTFTPTADLVTARYSHTATLLPGGSVLMAGGFSGLSLRNAEVFDPVAELFTPTGDLLTPREYHTATLLTNGKVLVTGGITNGAATETAELYDPATGLFTATGSLNTVRIDHTATLLASGQVLIVGGRRNLTAYEASAELYDPGTGLFTTLPATLALGARALHTATLLGNGKVLIAGGYSGTINLASAEVYDPTLGTFAAAPTAMAVPRAYHTATRLPNGQVLLVGGANTATAELYDPAAGTFANTTGNLVTPRLRFHAAALLPSGKVLLCGGVGSGSPSLLAAAELFDPASGTFAATGSMTEGRQVHTATALANGKVLVAGGSGAGYLMSAELYY